MIRIIAFAAALLAVLAGCEDNEHPFEDAWAVGCATETAPAMTAWFTDPRALDDGGNRREYIGRVEVPVGDVADVWVWQLEVNLRERTAETVALEHVPLPESYAADFRPLQLDVASYMEAADTTSATMGGTCSWGEETGDLVAYQNDDCDLCIDCDTGGTPASLAALLAVLALMASGARRGGAYEPPGSTNG